MSENDDEPIRIGDHVTIRPRGKKRTWTAEYWQDDQHRRQSLRTRNLKIAKERARRLELELAEGIHPNHRRKLVTITLKQAIIDHETYLKAERRRRKTIVKYQGILARKFAPFAATHEVMNVGDVTLRLIDQYRVKQSAEISERSMHNEGVVLKGFFGWCADRRMIEANPLGSRKFKRPKHKPRGGPTLEQINQVLSHCTDIRLAPLAMLAFAGMRAGECQRLRPEDVDTKGNWIHIVSRPDYETKTGDSWKVPIHPRLLQILEQVPKGRRDWFFTALPSPRYPAGGHHLNMKHVCEDFEKVLRQLGIPAGKKHSGYTLHSLRSSFKTISIHAAIPREVVDAWQGHASRRPTASDAYYKLDDVQSQAFMLRVPFGTADSPGDGENQGGG